MHRHLGGPFAPAASISATSSVNGAKILRIISLALTEAKLFKLNQLTKISSVEVLFYTLFVRARANKIIHIRNGNAT
jgi:hypothetical protein